MCSSDLFVIPLLLNEQAILGHIVEGLEDRLQGDLIFLSIFLGGSRVRTIDDRIDLRRAHHRGQKLWRELGWTDYEPARNAVEGDKCQGRAKLIVGMQEDAAVPEGVGCGTSFLVGNKIRKLHARTGVGDVARPKIAVARDEPPQRFGLTL